MFDLHWSFKCIVASIMVIIDQSIVFIPDSSQNVTWSLEIYELLRRWEIGRERKHQVFVSATSYSQRRSVIAFDPKIASFGLQLFWRWTWGPELPLPDISAVSLLPPAWRGGIMTSSCVPGWTPSGTMTVKISEPLLSNGLSICKLCPDFTPRGSRNCKN